jgi:hypothetical protein
VELEASQVVGLGLLAHLVGDEDLQVERRDVLLAVRDLLDALEGGVQGLAVETDPQLLERVAKGVAARVPEGGDDGVLVAEPDA